MKAAEIGNLLETERRVITSQTAVAFAISGFAM